MPKVSIILPTYNRADTLARAIASIQAQTVQDWELVIVDDGSTDQTAQLIATLNEPRIVYLSQTNQGVTAARNRALAACRGEFVAFLDSDDEWLKFHLELCLNFLAAHPDAAFVTCALLEDFGNQRQLLHYTAELADWYPNVAKQVGSSAFNLPAGESDHHLSVYQERRPIGEWGKNVLQRHQLAPDFFHYSGQTFSAWRWGFLMWLPTTVMRRNAASQLGEFQQAYPICSDFAWMAEAARQFRTHYLSLPTAIKHDLGINGKPLNEGHIAKHKTQAVAAADMLRHFEDHYWQLNPTDPELCRLRSYKQLYVAQIQLLGGLRLAARGNLQAAFGHSTKRWQVVLLWLFTFFIPHDKLSQKIYLSWFRIKYTANLIKTGKYSLSALCLKLAKRALGALAIFCHLKPAKP